MWPWHVKIPTQNLLRFLLLLMLMLRIMLATVCYRFWSWGLVMKLNFVQTLSTGLVKSLKLKLRQNFKLIFDQYFADVWLRLRSWIVVKILSLSLVKILSLSLILRSKCLLEILNLIKMCVRTCDKNWTLGSVVPLAMFVSVCHYQNLYLPKKNSLKSSFWLRTMQVVKIQALIVLPQFLQVSWPALPRRERWPTWIVNMHQTPSRSSSPSSDPPIAFEPGHLDNAMKNLSFLRLLNQIPANSSHQHQYAPAQQGTLWQILPYSFIKDLSFSWWFLETHNLMQLPTPICAAEDTVTTLAPRDQGALAAFFNSGRSSLVKRKWPKWLTPI